MLKNWLTTIVLALLLASPSTNAMDSVTSFGNTLEINTHFNGYQGLPSWLLIVRDLDHKQNIPYMFDIYSNNNYWVAFTYSHQYQILASQMTFATSNQTIHNFCGLESFHIVTGDSIRIVLSGYLTPNRHTFDCNVLKFPNTAFAVAP